MDNQEKFSPDFILKLFDGDGVPVTVRYIYMWLGETKTEFAIGGESFTDTPIWLGALSEEEMQKATILDVVNAPAHLKGEWKQVFDERKNVVVKYFPTPEEEEEQKRIKKAHDDTTKICLYTASFL